MVTATHETWPILSSQRIHLATREAPAQRGSLEGFLWNCYSEQRV